MFNPLPFLLLLLFLANEKEIPENCPSKCSLLSFGVLFSHPCVFLFVFHPHRPLFKQTNKIHKEQTEKAFKKNTLTVVLLVLLIHKFKIEYKMCNRYFMNGKRSKRVKMKEKKG